MERGITRKRRLTEYIDVEEENTETNFEAYYRVQNIVKEDEWQVFMDILKKPLPEVFRVDPSGQFYEDIRSQLENDFMKTLEFEVTDGDEGIPVRPLPWYPNNMAWHLNFSRMQLCKNQTLERFHHFLKQANDTGNITRQEAVSMVPPLFLDVRPEHFVLDMCADSGSKTFQLLEIMQQLSDSGSQPTGLVIANDVDAQRCNLLMHQTKRICCANLMITNHEAQHFPSCSLSKNGLDTPGLGNAEISQLLFDKVLCDVPCSEDGTLRKAPEILRNWSVGTGNEVHPLQVQIAMRGISLLKVGGRMVYSTCSMNPVENEAVVAEILRRCEGSVALLDVSSELPQLVCRPGIKSWKVCDKGAWLASYKDVTRYRRTAIVPSMFPSGHSFDDETAVPSSLDESMVPPGDDNEMESVTNVEEKCESGCNVDSDHVTRQLEILVTPTDALEMEVSDLPLERCMRIVPHDQNTGAFFIAILQKVSPLPAVSSSTKLKESSTKGNYKLPLELSDEMLVDTITSEVITSLDEAKQESPILSNVASGGESSDKPTEVGASGLDSHGEVEENEKEPTQNVNGETDTNKTGGNRRLQNQGSWRDVDPVVFFREDTVLSSIKNYYGISDSFPWNDHLVTRNADFQSCKSIYYVSKSVQGVMKLNFQVGKQLKIICIGLKAFEQQTVKEDSASECMYRISSEALPLLLPHISKQVLCASLEDFKRLLQYRSSFFSEFVDPQFGEKASQLQPGCCITVLRTEHQPTSEPMDAFTIAIGCWRGKASVGIMVSETECQQLLNRLSVRFGFDMVPLRWKMNRRHGSTIAGISREDGVYMATDGIETETVEGDDGEPQENVVTVTKTDILYDRVLLAGAGDAEWIIEIIDVLKMPGRPQNALTAEDFAYDAHRQMKSGYLKDADMAKDWGIDSHMFFGSFENGIPTLWFASRKQYKEVPQGVCMCIGGGKDLARDYLGKFVLNDLSPRDLIGKLVLSIKAACGRHTDTGGQIRALHMPRPCEVHLLRDIHERHVNEDYIVQENNEDAVIDAYVRAHEGGIEAEMQTYAQEYRLERRRARRRRRARLTRKKKLKWYKVFSMF